MFRIPIGDQELSIPIDSPSPSRIGPAADEAPVPLPQENPVLETDLGAAASAMQPESTAVQSVDSPVEAPTASEPQPETPLAVAAVKPRVEVTNDSPPDVSQHETSQDESSPLAAASDVVWYVRPPSGGQYGPAGGALMQQWIQEHRVVPGSLVWRDGWAQWQAAEDVFGRDFGSSGVADIDLNADLPEIAAGSQSAAKPNRFVDPMESEPKTTPTEFERRQLAKRKRRTRMIAMLTGISLFLIVVIILVVLSKSGDA
ncbi:DUF4339 domain-containing protein [Rosistilla ulvae]|uniref:DUF4339 domain-containing protein n=1 Tax=Rosistilla ulvae TaxID=1930277 RepID=UPI00119D6155|nr:DUF4339 domain-containing protein [Rosistilla ulvae]